MPFPGSSDYPDSVDTAYGSGSARVDGVDIVYDDDYNFPDIQIRNIQTYLGTTGQLIGQGIAAKGPGGLVSPLADGGGVKGIRLALRAAFSTGDILSVGDNYDAAYTEKMRLGPAGILWALGGADFGSGEFLRIPHGNTLPATFEEGRLFRKDDTDELYHADGSAWNAVGGGAGGKEMDWVDAYQYTQLAAPSEETVCFGYFDASTVTGTISFWAVLTATLTAAGSSQIRLYDVGPAAGPPVAPTLITTLSTATTGGPQHLSQSLSVGASPAAGQIANSARMYEVRAYQTSTPGDSFFLGSGGMADR